MADLTAEELARLKIQEDNLAEYLQMTGETVKQLYGGAFAFGEFFILENLVPRAIAAESRIVWHDVEGSEDAMTYSFEPIKK